MVLVDTYNLLGTCAAQNGQYARAIAHYREALARSEKLGPAAKDVLERERARGSNLLSCHATARISAPSGPREPGTGARTRESKAGG